MLRRQGGLNRGFGVRIVTGQANCHRDRALRPSAQRSALSTPTDPPPHIPTSPAPVSAYAALIVGAVAMGISPIFVRLADVGPFTSAFWRVALALPVLHLWMRFDEHGAAPGARFSRATILAGLAFAGDLFFWHLAIVKTSVANATFFATTAPIFVVLFGFLLLGKRVSTAVFAGLALCIAGGALLAGQSFGLSGGRMLGDLFGVATAVFFGLYFLAVTAARASAGAARVTFELTIVTALCLLVVALLLEAQFWPRGAAGWAALFGMAWFSHAGGQGLLSIALGRLPTVFSSLVIFLEAIAAAFFGWLFLAEPVTPVQALGGAVILVGIWVARPRAGGLS
jgi:drug/metabolite transporter (DMT)-like permease